MLMKILALVPLVLLVAIFVLALFWPAKSRRLQETVKKVTADAATRLRGSGTVGNQTAGTIEKASRATQEAAHSGRRAHDALFDSNQGQAQEEVLEDRYGDRAERGDEA
jgi:hypothetical protein